MLASIATSEIAYYAEERTLSDNFETIGWEPNGETKYYYFISQKFDLNKSYFLPTYRKGVREKSIGVSFNHDFLCGPEPSNIRIEFNKDTEAPIDTKQFGAILAQYNVGATKDSFTAIAIGNIDDDPELDIWIISREKVPRNVQEDISDDTEARKKIDMGVIVYYKGGTVIIYLNFLWGILFLFSLFMKLILHEYYFVEQPIIS